MPTLNIELAKIKKLLKDNPQGLTITQISKEIRINRNSIAKYLEILKISGVITNTKIGPAKVYTLSNNIPFSAMIQFTSEGIIVINKNNQIVQINDYVLNLLEIKKEEIISKEIDNLNIDFFKQNDFLNIIENLKDPDKKYKEIKYDKNKKIYYFKIKIFPIIFEDGDQGHTIVIENITKEKSLKKKYQILFQTTTDLILQIDTKGKILTINKAMAKSLNKKIRDVEDKNISEIFTKDIAEELQDNGLRAIKNKKIIYKEEVRNFKYYSTLFIPIFVPGDEPTFQIQARDITKQNLILESAKTNMDILNVQKSILIIEKLTAENFYKIALSEILDLSESEIGIIGKMSEKGLEIKYQIGLTRKYNGSTIKINKFIPRDVINEENISAFLKDFMITKRIKYSMILPLTKVKNFILLLSRTYNEKYDKRDIQKLYSISEIFQNKLKEINYEN